MRCVCMVADVPVGRQSRRSAARIAMVMVKVSGFAQEVRKGGVMYEEMGIGCSGGVSAGAGAGAGDLS